MDWQELRAAHPHSWVVVEAIDAYTEGAKRVINNLRFIEAFGDDWKGAWDKYKTLHAEDKWREYYFLHTDRVELDIGVMDAFRRRITE